MNKCKQYAQKKANNKIIPELEIDKQKKSIKIRTAETQRDHNEQ